MSERLLTSKRYENNLNTSHISRTIGLFAVRTSLVVTSAAAMLVGITAAETVANTMPAAKAESPFDAINGAEKAWCRWPSRWPLCLKAQDLADGSLADAKFVAGTNEASLHNGWVDGFRHCIWSGRMARLFGVATAQEFGDRHEYNEVQPENERQMDLYNNAKGREYALQTSEVYNRCMRAMLNHELYAIENV